MGRSDICCGQFGTSFRARKWLSLNPCGLICVHFSLLVHVFALAVISLKLIKHSSFTKAVFFALYVPTAALALSSLYMAWTTNPGAVPMGARPLTTFRRSSSSSQEALNNSSRPSSSAQRGTRRCHKCNDNYKPSRAHHDSVTGRCIVKLDHYCPWVGNAVGALNHKFFVLFIFYTLLTSLQALMFICISFVRCGYIHAADDADTNGAAKDANREEDWEGSKDTNQSYDDPKLLRWLERPHYLYEECNDLYNYNLVVILLVVSISFFIFTIVMLVEQAEAIESNTGKIARMKLRVGIGGTELHRVTHTFNEMFGGESTKCTWHWLLPLPVKFPKGMEKVVLGYEWDECFEPVPFISPDEDEQDDDDVNVDMMAEVVGNEDEPRDLESKGLRADPNSAATLGDSHDDSSYASVPMEGVRKRESFNVAADDDTVPSIV